MTKMIVDIPEEIKKAFKIKCIASDTTIKEVIIQLMKGYIGKGGIKTYSSGKIKQHVTKKK